MTKRECLKTHWLFLDVGIFNNKQTTFGSWVLSSSRRDFWQWIYLQYEKYIKECLAGFVIILYHDNRAVKVYTLSKRYATPVFAYRSYFFKDGI